MENWKFKELLPWAIPISQPVMLPTHALGHRNVPLHSARNSKVGIEKPKKKKKKQGRLYQRHTEKLSSNTLIYYIILMLSFWEVCVVPGRMNMRHLKNHCNISLFLFFFLTGYFFFLQTTDFATVKSTFGINTKLIRRHLLQILISLWSRLMKQG